jgi:general stress protein 26
MAKLNLHELSELMREIDFVMLQTRTEGGKIAGRPMSNNRDVEFDGDSFFFLAQDTRTFSDIRNDPNVNLAVQGSKGLFGAPPTFISIEGRAEIILDKEEFEAHWNPDLDRWFKGGLDTPGLAMIKVHASRIHYWSGEDEGEVFRSELDTDQTGGAAPGQPG